MIAKQIKGQLFSGVLKYMDLKVKQGAGEMLDSNLIATESVKSMTQEFNMISSLRPIKNKVYHVSLSIQKDERLSNQEFSKLGKDYLVGMGFKDSQFVIYRHVDRDHPHIHCIANRVNMNSKIVSDKWDYRRSEKLVRELEEKYGLKPVVSSKEIMESSLSKGQVGKYKRTGEVPVKTQLQIIAKDALKNAKNLTEFEQVMAKGGAGVQVHYNSKGKAFGISFILDNVVFKGSSLGKGYSINKINQQLRINNERDRSYRQSQSGRTNQNFRSANRTNTDYQPGEYSTTQSGNATLNSGINSSTNEPKVRGSKYSGTANESQEFQQRFNGSDAQGVGQNGKTEEAQQNVQSEAFQFSSSSGNNIQLSGVGGNSSYDDDEIKKKKRKQKTKNGRIKF